LPYDFLTGGKGDENMTSTDQIRDAVEGALRRLVPECPEHLDDHICPIQELGLASHEGAEFALELEDRLGCSIDKLLNPLVDDDRKRPRKLGEISSWLEALIFGQQREFFSGRDTK
jgi:hypothetical protein